MTGKTMAEVLAEHSKVSMGMTSGSPDTCKCGERIYPGQGDADITERRDASFAAHQSAALSAAGFGLVADAKAEALRGAAEALEMQAPKLRAQYVETLRLYASEPWRLTTCPSECAANHPGREHGAAS